MRAARLPVRFEFSWRHHAARTFLDTVSFLANYLEGSVDAVGMVYSVPR